MSINVGSFLSMLATPWLAANYGWDVAFALSVVGTASTISKNATIILRRATPFIIKVSRAKIRMIPSEMTAKDQQRVLCLHGG